MLLYNKLYGDYFMEKAHNNRFNAYRQGPNRSQNHHRPGKRLTGEDLQSIRANNPNIWGDATDQEEYSNLALDTNNTTTLADFEASNPAQEPNDIFNLSLDELDAKRQEAFAVEAESDDFRLYNDAFIQKRSDILGQIKADKKQPLLALEYTPENTSLPVIINQDKKDTKTSKTSPNYLLADIDKNLTTYDDNENQSAQPNLLTSIDKSLKSYDQQKTPNLFEDIDTKLANLDNNAQDAPNLLENIDANLANLDTEDKKQGFFSRLGATALGGYRKLKDKFNTFSVNTSSIILARQSMNIAKRELAKEKKEAQKDEGNSSEQEARRKKWLSFALGGSAIFGVAVIGMSMSQFYNQHENKSNTYEPPQEQTDLDLDKEVNDQIISYKNNLEEEK